MQRKKQTVYRRRGFTLLEALTASMILGGAVATLCGINTRCLTQARENRQYEQAWQVADKQLAMVEQIGIDTVVEQEIMQGETELFGREYYWQMRAELLEINNLYRVELAVSWLDGTKLRQVKVQTEFNGQGMAI